jgi:hypothetical protein
MTSKNPRKKYFRPKTPVDKLTEQELDEFANLLATVCRRGVRSSAS